MVTFVLELIEAEDSVQCEGVNRLCFISVGELRNLDIGFEYGEIKAHLVKSWLHDIQIFFDVTWRYVWIHEIVNSNQEK